MILILPSVVCETCTDALELEELDNVYPASGEGTVEMAQAFSPAKMRKAAQDVGYLVTLEGLTYCPNHSEGQESYEQHAKPGGRSQRGKSHGRR